MGKKGKKATTAAGAAAEAERMKKVCSNCSKVGSGDEKNFSKCAFCELTRYCSRDCQKAHWKEHKEECNRVVMKCWFKAAVQGRFDDIKRLLEQGIKVDRTTEPSGEKGYAALACAAMGGWNEIVKLLLENGADVDKAGDCEALEGKWCVGLREGVEEK